MGEMKPFIERGKSFLEAKKINEVGSSTLRHQPGPKMNAKPQRCRKCLIRVKKNRRGLAESANKLEIAVLFPDFVEFIFTYLPSYEGGEGKE